MADPVPDPEDVSVDEETADEMQQAVAESDQDVSTEIRIAAGAQLLILFGLALASIGLSVWTGIIQPNVVVKATVNIGWLIEIVIGVFGLAFILYVMGLVFTALPGSVMEALAALGYGVAKSAGMIDDNDNDNDNNE